MLLCLRMLAHAPAQLREADMAVRDERAHLEVGRQCERSLIERVRIVELPVRARNFRHETKDPGLEPTLMTVTRQGDCVIGDLPRLFQSTSEEIRLAEKSEPWTAKPRRLERVRLAHALLQQLHAVRHTPAERVDVPEQ